MAPAKAAPRIFIVAGETSGDILGAGLMAAIRQRVPDTVFLGVGGPAMSGQGLSSLFPMDDIAVMGLVPVIKRLPQLLARIRQTADACIAAKPDVLVIIDSPDFTHRVARRVRAAAPDVPILDYVSPTVWAWRQGRAKTMRRYIDHVLAVLPFEPEAHRRLGGPACTYVGHPFVTRLPSIRPTAEESRIRAAERRILLLPGSRGSEVGRLMPVFRETVALVAAQDAAATFHLPAVPHLVRQISNMIADWPVKPEIIEDEAGKLAAFRTARAALAASGTVTLELALAQIPTVAAYRVSKIEEHIVRALVKVSTPILPSLILGHDVVPIYLQEAASPANLAAALLPLLGDTTERAAQLADFEALEVAMHVPGNDPSAAAAELVLKQLNAQRT